MKPHNKLVLFMILLGITWLPLYAQSSLNRVNFAYQYDPKGEIFVSNLINSNGIDSVTLFSNLFINETETNISHYQFQLYLADSYTSEPQPLNYDSTYIGSRGNNHFLEFSLPRWPTNKLLVLHIKSAFSSIDYYYDIQPVEILPLYLQDQSEVPVAKSWIRSNIFTVSKPGISLYYDYDFEPALPPMVTRAPNPQKEMVVNATSEHGQSSFPISKEGLHLFQTDTAQDSGLPVLLVNKYFPKPARLDQLIDPLIYITQKEEWEVLSGDSATKKDFDQYWLSMTKSTDRAKKVIKTYYDRIEEANQFFTTYKEGWKTDRGMIYSIFGVPDRVIRKADKETWYYNATSAVKAIDFEFIRINSIFSNCHYVLIRDRRYSNAWYEAINNLRKVRY